MKLLLDNNLSPRLARCLQALFEEHKIAALREKFPANTPDTQWIKTLDAEGGWAVLTEDLRIRTRPHEKAALDQSRIVYFFLTGSWRKCGVEQKAARLIRLIPMMAMQTKIAERGRFELPFRGAKLRPHRD